ncbi:MAG: NADH-quinone oxidoreductase subunit F [Alphaproteobacteria bacterium]|nr:NADH-quinone oxidoreductase subunit F [Alphaproteobacteria bacterium]
MSGQPPDAAAKMPRRPGRRGRVFERGRQASAASVQVIHSLLGPAPPRRDLLIEYLHRIQDRFGHLDAGHLAALAKWMGLPLAEIYEVASFYAHFDLAREPGTKPPRLTVRVCDGLPCAIAGGNALAERLVGRLPTDVRVKRAPCMGRCDGAPVVEVGRRHLTSAVSDRVAEVVEAGMHDPFPGPAAAPVGPADLAQWRRCVGGQLTREAVGAEIERAGLRGLGGAGFPVARKWRLVRNEPAPRFLAVNADEGEPGTFKDRHYLEAAPRQFLEGMLIAAWLIEATAIYIYLRDEYRHLHAVLGREIDQLSQSVPGFPAIHLRRGAGAYICGEESAMLESLEGKRGLPRQRPPYPAQVGLFGRPTLIHNVETLYWIPALLTNGADWFLSHGRRGRFGMRTFSLSGRVRTPGVKLAPAGISARELIDEFGGGMAPGHEFAAYLPGGASGGILPASLGDIPLDFGTLEPHGALIGSAAVIVLSDHDDIAAAARNLMRFFAHESCGQCTPCRVGTDKASALMATPHWDTPLLAELATCMQDASICGLGQAAANPITSMLRYFPGLVR